MIPFTRRELTNAWRGAQAASIVVTRANPHRLLLFYSVECGLKAVYLKRRQADFIDDEIGQQLKHDLNRVMTLLFVAKEYFLPTDLILSPFRQKNGTRTLRFCDVGTLNQVWRYGGSLVDDGDMRAEQQLEKINEWIAKEIQ
ncbi:MAG: hypothetical protein ACYCSZ_00855 [Burkholderiales bacterium]